MTWNHRIIATDEGVETVYRIHEVFYDDDGNPTSWTSEPVIPSGESMQDIRYEYEQMRLAFFRAPLFVHTENENMILKPEDTDKVSLDDYHRHEALDRTAIFADQFETHVASHPAIDYDPKLKSMAEEIADKLAALYQSIGQLSNATVNREPDG